MAGDWIKMRVNLWDDPRVSKLCDLCDCGEAQVVGGLYWLWSTADQHTADGIMLGLTLRQIDRKTGIQGFGDALRAIGWLAIHADGIRIVNFEEHNGASAKKRVVTAKRVANHRAGNADVTPSDESGNADVTSAALPDEHTSVSGALAREEKRREEKRKSNTPPLSPPGGGASSPQFSETDQNEPGAIDESSGYLPLTLPAIVLPAHENGPSRAVSDAGQIKQKRKAVGLAVSVAAMVEAGMQPETAELFVAHKARLKAPLTPLAWAAHLRESAKAGITPEATAIIVMERGWKGFQAEYVAGKDHSSAPGRAKAGQDEPEWRREQRERNEAFFGPFAAKRRPETIDVEVRDAAPDFLG